MIKRLLKKRLLVAIKNNVFRLLSLVIVITFSFTLINKLDLNVYIKVYLWGNHTHISSKDNEPEETIDIPKAQDAQFTPNKTVDHDNSTASRVGSSKTTKAKGTPAATFENAKQIDLNKSRSDSLSKEQGAKFYKFSVKEACWLYIEFTNKKPDKSPALSSMSMYVINVMDSKGNSLFEKTVRRGDNHVETNHESFEAGTYYVKISRASSYSDGGYELIINSAR